MIGGENMSAPAILTVALAKTYRHRKDLPALLGLDLEVCAGDIYAFIGPNGAGKTTTIKLLVGLLHPDAGRASIFGHPAGSMAAQSRLGFLPEVSYYYKFLEAGELLAFYASLHGLARSEIRRRVIETMALVNLADAIDLRLAEYSKGMLQRFGIAQAIIGDPDLLILDEVTSGLDPIGQKAVMDIILALKERGKTIFFSSHRLTEVEQVCDKAGILNRGRLIRSGKLHQIFTASGDRFQVAWRTRGGSEILTDPVNRDGLPAMLEKLLQEGAEVYEVGPLKESPEALFCRLIEKDDAHAN